MPSTYSPNLRIELIATGEQSGTWGTTTNTNLGTLIEDAIAGYVSVSITSANQALTASNGSADQSRNMTINLTTTTTADFNVYVPPAEKFYVIRNSSAYNATIYCSTVLGNTTAAGTGVTVTAGETTIIFTDATNVVSALNYLPGSLDFGGTASRLRGDFTNATVSSRLMFQTTSANSSTGIYAIPSGSSTAASWQATNNSDPTNASKILIATNGSTDVQLVSGINGSGTYLPLTFYNNGSEKLRLDTAGNFLIGGTAARGTTVGTAHLDLFNGTAPAGTLTNGVSVYSASGDLNFMDSAGNGYKVGYRNIPAVGTKTGSYTLQTADVGKYVQVGTGGAITIPDATFAEGDVISLFNNTTGNITITCTITTAYIAGTDADKATMTLATRGVATIFFISSTVCVVTGNVT